MYGEMDKPRFGLEQSFDSVLRGTPGLYHKQQVRNRKLKFVDVEPIDGEDIVTTINNSYIFSRIYLKLKGFSSLSILRKYF